MNLYAAQAFYQAGDKYWDDYFPRARDALIASQAKTGPGLATRSGRSSAPRRADRPATALQIPSGLPAIEEWT